ncbi:MAG: HPF/RaiA family ribosome-associated protein [Phycisphaerales bacterium JB040]
MHIEINANDFELTDPIAEHVIARVEKELSHLADRVTRVEAHLGDHNASKQSDGDKRCMLEARPRGLDPIAVTAEHHDLYQAISEAAGKLRRALKTTLDKRD